MNEERVGGETPRAGEAGTTMVGGTAASSHLFSVYARQPVALVRGAGAYVWDTEGRRYLDFVSGIAVNALGHAHPRLAEAIATQASRLIHVSNLYQIPQQEELAAELAELSGLDRFFFCNSGAEANELALKIARRWGWLHGKERPRVITLSGAFHGRTLATLAATGNPHYMEGFGPALQGFDQVPVGDEEALRAAIGPDTAALLLEVIQGEGGVRELPADYLRAAEQICHEQGLLLLIDEVQTGLGRTGDWFAFQECGLRPDVVTMAKALAGGVPIGAVGAREEVAEVMTPGTHGSTFGGNPLAVVAALTVLNEMRGQSLPQRAREMGGRLRAGLEQLAAPAGLEVRGRGLLLGVCLSTDWPVGEAVAACREAGLLVASAGENVLRLLPPLIVGPEEVDEALQILAGVFAQRRLRAPVTQGEASA